MVNKYKIIKDWTFFKFDYNFNEESKELAIKIYNKFGIKTFKEITFKKGDNVNIESNNYGRFVVFKTGNKCKISKQTFKKHFELLKEIENV